MYEGHVTGYQQHGRRRPGRHPFDKRRKRVPSCVKCGREGHVYRECTEPITSFGIIALRKVDPVKSPTGPFITRSPSKCSFHRGFPDTENEEVTRTEDGDISYLMVQRKDTMGYIDFIRGRWPEDDAERKKRALTTYLEEMTCEERARLTAMDFESLWDLIWINHTSRIYISEFVDAKRKFETLDINHWVENTRCNWTEQEYGFPKGRKNMYEGNVDCAKREFKEETGYGSHQYRMLSDLPWEETFVGTNGIAYKHVYYLAEVLPESGPPKTPIDVIRQEGEISNMGWFTYSQCLRTIRPYDTAKKALLQLVHRRCKNLYTYPIRSSSSA
jgi:8-oxo-dGTP pyrophosphatase MutT (NUDIX family)